MTLPIKLYKWKTTGENLVVFLLYRTENEKDIEKGEIHHALTWQFHR